MWYGEVELDIVVGTVTFDSEHIAPAAEMILTERLMGDPGWIPTVGSRPRLHWRSAQMSTKWSGVSRGEKHSCALSYVTFAGMPEREGKLLIDRVTGKGAPMTLAEC